MCLGVCYKNNEQLWIVHFTEPGARLPVLTKKSEMELIPWGRRLKEKGKLPFGGWLTQDSLQKGQWDYFFPKSVKIPVIKFMEEDIEGQLHWFDITKGQWIQGALLKDENETRLYTVVLTPEKANHPYLRWPRIFSG